MPEQKGRKRRPRERRRGPRPVEEQREAAGPEAGPKVSATPQPSPGVPSPTARATGFLIAVITLFLAVMMIIDAPDAGGIEAVIRAVVGVALVLVAVAVGVLVLFPEQVRRRVRGE